jgi:hypothetical protein
MTVVLKKKKRSERKLQRFISKYYPIILVCLEGLKKITRNLSISSVQTKFESEKIRLRGLNVVIDKKIYVQWKYVYRRQCFMSTYKKHTNS